MPELWENWGRRRQGQPRRNLGFLPSPPQCSQLSKRLVQFVTLKLECTVCFIWPLSRPALATLYLYLLLQPWDPAVSHPCSHVPTSHLPRTHTSPVVGHAWVLNSCRRWGVGYRDSPGGEKWDSGRIKPPGAFLSLVIQPSRPWTLQAESEGTLGL